MSQHDNAKGEELPDESSPFMAAARELARNPDSPASLRIMSEMKRVLAPSQRVVEELVQALCESIENPGLTTNAQVAAAKARWEQVTGAQLDAGLMRKFEEDAHTELEDRMRRPPPLEQVLEQFDPAARTPDCGYKLGADLEGLQGTWHRLWALLRLQASSKMDMTDGIEMVRAQFETLLGRGLQDVELARLTRHAAALAPQMRSQFEALAAKANKREPEPPG
ncbi:hypothetical protein FN976_11205 [Caenimonas sedimenti]|uniref:Uncharacterized protein n=1 Tax=Caenimonas sedimenti TaxID=2596921 RepID=A0A562ZT62_9BURK|nr:hypothetical protein [Caenimonas sedimenti]TWO71475.1 hypothetical protein FN976_11205 [Caenimonas sedimenti]